MRDSATMIHRINRVLFGVLIIGFTLYLVILNPTEQTIFLTRSYSITTYAGVILLGAFAAGFALSFIGAVWFGIKSFFREQSWKRAESKQQRFFEIFEEARAFQAAGEVGKAQSLWEKFIALGLPIELESIARIELSKLLPDQREALKMIDAARALAPDNVEILFRAADINEQLGNNTAALDNLALIMYHHPNRKAAKKAAELAVILGRTADAKEYADRFSALGGDGKSLPSLSRLELNQALDATTDSNEEIKLLRNFIKSSPDDASAYESLADRYQDLGNIPEAAQTLSQAAERFKTLAAWREVIELWLGNNNPDRALAAAKRAKVSVGDAEKSAVLLELSRLYTRLGMLDEASKEVKELSELSGTLPVPVRVLGELYQASIALRQGNVKAALEHLDSLIQFGPKSKGVSPFHRDAPAPELSTP